MAMRESKADVEFENGKCCKLRATFNNGTSGVSSPFVSEFLVQTTLGTAKVKEGELIKGLCDEFLTKLANIQSHEISWTKVYVEPNVEQPNTCFYGFIDPVRGKVAAPTVKDHDYVLNLLIEKSNQSRNVVVPGVAEPLMNRADYKSDLETLEKLLVTGVKVTDKLTLAYIRINKKDQKENVVGALFTGFRKRN